MVFFAGDEVGGAASHIRTFAEAVAASGIRNRYLFVSLGHGPLEQAVRHAEVPMEVIEEPPVSCVARLAEMAVARNVWLIHSHGPRLNILTSFASRRSKVPWTATIHSHPLYDFLGSRLKSFLYPKLHLWSLKQAFGLFVIQPALADILPVKTVLEVPNAVHLTPLDRPRTYYREWWQQQLGLPASTTLIGIAARLDPVKNIDILIEAMKDVAADVHLLIAGDGSERDRLQDITRRLQLEDRVHFLGFQTDMAAFYGAIDIHILPSKSEGTPTSMLEAGFYGAVNVGSDIPSLRNLLLDGQAGPVVAVGDAAALASTLNELVADETKRSAYIERFQSAVLPKFSRERMLEAYLRGYSVLEEDLVRSGRMMLPVLEHDEG